jgi:glucan phosphoethanolaminetransferase (alkaline phosphatase superfamily)
VVVQWGILAVATAFTAVIYLMAPLWILNAHKLITLDARRYFGQIAPALVASTTMMAVLFLLKVPLGSLPLAWRVAVLISAGALTYAAVLWIVGRSVVLEAIDLARLASPAKSP